jgi:SAM-dependent methyltransferase
MAVQPLLRCCRLTMRFGGLVALSELDLAVAPRSIHGVIGPNGAGKTTVFNDGRILHQRAATGLQQPPHRGWITRGEKMDTREATYATWHREPEREAQMGNSHLAYWRHFIKIVPETDLSSKTVLDFGCNQGGFLRLLHALRPFRRGIGVDIARDSIEVARSLKGTMPLEYEVATDLAPWAGTIDVAFSYEVIYLLPDLPRHAEQIRQVLRDGGVYYAVTGCHTDSHLWPLWRNMLAETSNAPVHDYSPDDYIDAFVSQGFAVSLKRFGFDDFVPATKDRRSYPKIIDALAYPAEDKLLFRIANPSSHPQIP